MRKLIFTLTSILIALTITPALAAMSMPTMTPPPISGTAAMMGGTIFDSPLPAVIANTVLTDANGKNFTLGGLKGKYIVLTDFFTSCDMICPMTSVNMRDIGDSVKKAGLSKSVSVVEISVDPQRDTTSRINAYQALFGDPSWTIATGSAVQLKRFWSWFGVYTKVQKSVGASARDWQTGKPVTYDVLHDDVIMLIGPNGHWRWIDLGNPAVSNPLTLPKTLKNYLSPEGRLNLIKPQQPTWTLSAVYGALQQIFNLPIGPKMKM